MAPGFGVASGSLASAAGRSVSGLMGNRPAGVRAGQSELGSPCQKVFDGVCQPLVRDAVNTWMQK